MPNNDSTTLNIEQQQIQLDLKEGSLGPKVVDIAPLAKSGYFTFDPGFAATSACESKITFIDGAKGQLLYRGYPIEQLAKHSTYLETCYLLFNGELPSKTELQNFEAEIKQNSLLDEQIIKFFSGFRRDAHPMPILLSVVGALSSFHHSDLNPDPKQRALIARLLIAKIPTIAAQCYKYSISQPFVYPNNDLNYAENFLHMMFAVPNQEYKVNPILAEAMDKIFILHADHEQNASTSTVRLAGSTGANPFACIAAGIAALWGPAHGGANEAVINMLTQIGSVDNVGEYIKRAKDKDDPFRLMGFGHRVYKNFDPRAKILRESCYSVLDAVGNADNPLFKLALELEKIALEDDYFIQKKLYPNVDFYSGIILRAMGIPTSMFTVIFALARTVGWISQWNEMLSEPFRIGRPRQLYTGYTQRDYPVK